MLVENSLVAVVSLPAGCFNPYSGVKTSILILDKSLAKAADTIAFFKVENDGFGLGAQRRAIEKNDLPQVQAELAAYLHALRTKASTESILALTSTAQIVPKEKIAANGDYNLSGERYREGRERATQFPWVTLGEIIIGKPQYGSGASKVSFDGKVRYIRITDLTDRGELKPDDAVSPSTVEEDCFLKFGDLLIARSGSVGRTYLHQRTEGTFQYAGYLIRFRLDPTKAIPDFVFQITQSPHWGEWITQQSKTGTISNINAQEYASFRLPLPRLEVQKEIVAEIEGYQRVINGARAVLDHYRPHIPIQSDWPTVELQEVCEVRSGGTPSRSEDSFWNGSIPWVGSTVCKDGEVTKAEEFITEAGLNNSAAKLFPKDTTLIALVGATIGKTGLLRFESTTNQNIAGLYPKSREVLESVYLFHAAQQLYPEFMKLGEGKFRMANLSFVREQKIPLPPLTTQRAIVAEIEAEQSLVSANRELITRFEQKIQATLARIWGEAEPACADSGEKVAT